MGQKSAKMSHEELEQLESITKLNREQLQHKFRQFMEQNPKGVIDKESYLKMTTAACGDETRYMFERIFDVWDSNHDGAVDFKEFITSTSAMLHGSMEQKLRFAFDIYDENGDGSLNQTELVKMMSAAFAMVLNTSDASDSSATAADAPTPAERAARIMQIADTNRDGRITWDEFAAACTREPSLLDELGIAGLSS